MGTLRIFRQPILALGIALLLGTSTHAQEVVNLRAELEVLRFEIEQTRIAAEAETNPRVQDTIRQRLAVQRLSELLVQNRIYALDQGIDLAFTVPAIEPDDALADEINLEILMAEERINESVRRARGARGTALELALQRIEEEKLEVTYLRIAYYQARFGIYVPASPDAGAPPVRPERRASISAQPWADPGYPDVDYSHPLFRSSYEDGARISGWWIITQDRLVSGGRGDIFAQNLSHANFLASADQANARLYLQCENRVASLTFHLPDRYLSSSVASGSTRQSFEVSYRIDNADLERSRWDAEIAGQGASVSGFEAITVISRLYGAEALYIEIKEADGDRHDARFRLAGVEDVVDLVAEACRWHSLDLNREDYRLLQKLLNIMGFDAGIEDGIWGGRSRQAMMNYQRSVGLPSTGNPDIATLELLGLGS